MDKAYDFNIVFPVVNVEDNKKNANHKKFIISPLENGFGTTLGNALRRISLSTLPGSAVKKINIKGISHEFDVISNAHEDVTEVVLAIKNLKLRIENQNEDVILTLKGNKEGVLTAGDIDCPAGVKIINKKLKIVTLTEDSEFEMTLLASRGRGYVLAEQNRGKEKQANQIFVDSIYSPVEKFSFEVTDTRVGDKTNYDELTIDIQTNGMLTPEEVLSYSSHLIKEHVSILENIEEIIEASNVFHQEEKNQEEAILAEQEVSEETSIETLDISNRAYNGLKRANINTIETLILRSKKEISGLDNIGMKTVEEIEEHLKDLGVKFKED